METERKGHPDIEENKMSTLTARLRLLVNQLDSIDPRIRANIEATANEAADGLEWQNKIIAKLPTNADGDPVAAGMQAFIIVDSVILMRLVRYSSRGLVVSSGFVDDCPSTLKQSVVVSISNSYSTRENAEEARNQ